MNEIYLLLGSNVGMKREWMNKALALLKENCGVVLQLSSVYKTAAWGITDQESFLNQVVQMNTSLSATDLLTKILDIENHLGRKREMKWGPRIIDIDILLYDDLVMNTPTLVIPQPYMQDRRFTLAPLAEIAPHLVHPVFKLNINALLAQCPDKLEVIKLQSQD